VSLVITHLQHITYVHTQFEVNVKLSTVWFIRPRAVSVPTCHSTYTARQMANCQQTRHFYGTMDHHVAGITYAIYTAQHIHYH